MQGKTKLAKRDVPALVSQRTAEDNLWLALAGLTLAGRIQLLVSIDAQLLLSLVQISAVQLADESLFCRCLMHSRLRFSREARSRLFSRLY